MTGILMLERNGPVKGNNYNKVITMNDLEKEIREARNEKRRKKMEEIENDYQKTQEYKREEDRG